LERVQLGVALAVCQSVFSRAHPPYPHFPVEPPHIASSAKPENMARIQAVLLLSFLLAVSTASARILQQAANETAPATSGFASELRSAIEGAKTTANVSMFIYAWEEGGEGSTQITPRSSYCCSSCMHICDTAMHSRTIPTSSPQASGSRCRHSTAKAPHAFCSLTRGQPLPEVSHCCSTCLRTPATNGPFPPAVLS
jgi:hypothetical protein